MSEREIREVEDFKKLLREEGYSEKAIKEILKWYPFRKLQEEEEN